MEISPFSWYTNSVMKKLKLSKTSRGLLPVIIGLAWPTMLEQLLQTTVQYIDIAMVGLLGTDATAAVGSTTTVNWLVGGAISAIGIGFLSLIARAKGADEKEKIHRISAQAVLLVLISGLFFSLLTLSLSGMVPKWMQVDPAIQKLSSQYFFILYSPMLFRAANNIFAIVLRAVGNTKTPMLIGLLANIVNVVLNFFLIYPSREFTVLGFSIPLLGAGWGVLGAAVASAIAYGLSGILMTVALYRNKELSPRGFSIKPDKQILTPCLKIALPNLLQRFGTSFGYVVFASMINSLGEIATAAHTVANTVESAFYIPGYGMQTATATLAGNAYGAKDLQKMKTMARMITVIEVGLMILSGGLLFAFAPVMAGLFSKEPEVIRLSALVLRMVALSEPFFGISIVLEGLLQGLGQTRKPFLFNIIGMWGVRITGTFICIQWSGGGLVAAWGCMIAHNLLLCLFYWIHYKRGKWNPLAKNS